MQGLVHCKNLSLFLAWATSTLNSSASCDELYLDILCMADGVKAIIYISPKPFDMLFGGHMLRQRGFAEQQDSRAQLAAPWWPVWESPAKGGVASVIWGISGNAPTHRVQHAPICCCCRLWLR